MDFVLAGNRNEPVEKAGDLWGREVKQKSGATGDIVILEDQRCGHCGAKRSSADEADEPERSARGGNKRRNKDVGIEPTSTVVSSAIPRRSQARKRSSLTPPLGEKSSKLARQIAAWHNRSPSQIWHGSQLARSVAFPVSASHWR